MLGWLDKLDQTHEFGLKKYTPNFFPSLNIFLAANYMFVVDLRCSCVVKSGCPFLGEGWGQTWFQESLEKMELVKSKIAAGKKQIQHCFLRSREIRGLESIWNGAWFRENQLHTKLGCPQLSIFIVESDQSDLAFGRLMIKSCFFFIIDPLILFASFSAPEERGKTIHIIIIIPMNMQTAILHIYWNQTVCFTLISWWKLTNIMLDSHNY